LLAGGAALVGWWGFLAAAGEELAGSNPLVAAGIVPDDPRVAINLARMEFRTQQSVPRPEVMLNAVNALAKAPLASDPFFFAGMQALAARDEARGRRLIEEARRRSPRDTIVRIVALDGLLRSGSVKDAAAEVTVISRLMPQTATVLIPQLAKFATDPRTRPALADVLKNDPGMQDAVLSHLAGKGTDPQIVLSLAPPITPLPPGSQGPGWQAALVRSVIDSGDLGEARKLWARFAGVDLGTLNEGVYDGRFQRLPGAAPFNWQFTASGAGVAEPSRAPALQVEYYGRADVELASQIVPLRAGTYTISFMASGSIPRASGEGGLAWRVDCYPAKDVLTATPIRELSYSPKRLSGRFSLPAACPAIWLRLMGTGAEFAATHSVTITDLQIRRAS
jgi:hypothetical protein